ncbi:MAG TPA: Rieske (2Fe-2S) protein [Elusimicrobiales bacterium]|nr:Rieske (2Fe-2S) protein [Elusimicrobiales bacterium]
MSEPLEAAELGKLEEGRLHPVFPKGLPVLLVKIDGRVFALENRCAHMGCPLAAGTLDGYTLRCPCHDWRFDVRDGSFLDAPELRLKTYAVTVADGKVFIGEEK